MSTSLYKIIEGHDYEFPVIGYDRSSLTQDRVATPKNIYGTAFSVGGNCYITAGHSIANAASENEVIGIGFIDREKYILAEAAQYDVAPQMDVGFLRTIANIERAKAHPWEAESLPSLANVMASGYPFALDPMSASIQARSFKGYVVSRTRINRDPANPWVYELSFASPVGLSGAPLVALDGQLRVTGLVIGNYETKMLVFSQRETLSTEKEMIVETYHALQLGIAIQSSELLTLDSSVLSGALAGHLRQWGLFST